jgi:hypothetical protein
MMTRRTGFKAFEKKLIRGPRELAAHLEDSHREREEVRS